MNIGRWAFSFLFFATAAFADSGGHGPTSFSTLVTLSGGIEGLTSDYHGNLYTPMRQAAPLPCPVLKIPVDDPTHFVVVGNIPPAGNKSCSPSGLAFGPDGRMYVTQSDDNIYRFVPDETDPPTATVFASGVPGNNGLAFDSSGNLWTGDGVKGKGIVWRIAPDGAVSEQFRIPAMSNSVLGSAGVGRSVLTLPEGTAQSIVANGLQFDEAGDLIIADTARGALWKVHMKHDGTPDAHMGCDTTYPSDTLCLDQVWVQHPALEGADGFVLDVAGNAWVDANERNAVVFVANGTRQVVEVFRNPPDSTTHLRNLGPLETPTSPVLMGHQLCTANSDGDRRDNSPANVGEIGGSSGPKGKISCIVERVNVKGVSLPVH